MKALVLSGGGARGAYQAGSVLAMAQIAAKMGITQPVKIYSGVSAGAINAAFLAAQADDFTRAAENLVTLWTNISSEQVFKSDALSLGQIGLSWIKDLSMGGITGSSANPSLLDTSPLQDLIVKNITFAQIGKNLAAGHLHSLTITALDYQTSMAVNFVQSTETFQWTGSRRLSEQTLIHADHIMASSAIPILFPPHPIKGRYYGDGCVRNLSPLSPAIHLGASDIFVVGVRKQTSILNTPNEKQKKPSIARIANVLLNAVMLDGIEVDIERLKRINHFVDSIPENLKGSSPLRKVEVVWTHPILDIGHVAFENARKLPRFVRYLLKGLGSTEDAKEIISYLLFDPDFCKRLIDMGFEDAMRQEESIKRFLNQDEK